MLRGGSEAAAVLPRQRCVFWVQATPQSSPLSVSQVQKCACPLYHPSIYHGARWRDSMGTRRWEGWAAREGWAHNQTNKQKEKCILTSHQCNFGPVCSDAAACQAGSISSLREEEKKGGRRSDGKSKSVSNVCIHGHTRQTVVGTRSAKEGHW